MQSGLTGIGLVLALFLVVLAVLWMLIPFLIMGTNSRLNKIIAQNEQLLSTRGDGAVPQGAPYRGESRVGPSGEST